MIRSSFIRSLLGYPRRGQFLMTPRGQFSMARDTGIVLVAGRSATRSREDRHANARRPPVGSGSVAAAARVEPSPKGLAQAGKAMRTVGTFELEADLLRAAV
ncbi:hypothetical protein BBta_p0011 (plasmid) [Bradyrhizobium sp. BTAi1]|nr:hypothetical protein BBta_p0011 [Bradyrhizobium sp. BTAi1]